MWHLLGLGWRLVGLGALRSLTMSKRPQRWHLFGLYGFAVSSEDWESAPLFGDATLVPADFTKDFADPATADWMVGSVPYRDKVDVSQVSFGDLIAQPKPNSFIAVRRQHDPKHSAGEKASASTRAREIAALLTVARSHYSNQVDGFMDVTTLDRSPVCGVVKLPVLDVDSKQIVETIDRVYAARWLREPDRGTTDEVRKALADGAVLETRATTRWRLDRADPFVDLMVRTKRTPAEQRIARAAMQLYAAHYGVGPDERLGQAITSTTDL